jgi:hypothetical protein
MDDVSAAANPRPEGITMTDNATDEMAAVLEDVVSQL